MKSKMVLSITTALLCGFVGCGGGNSGSGTPSSENNTKTGSVGDGYIEGAYVCHDSDLDMSCLDETYATTASDGSFFLSNHDISQDLLVQIPVGAVDNGPFVDGSTMPRPFTAQTWYYYPAGLTTTNNEPIFIGPLSTMVFAQQENMPGLSVEDAVVIVGTTLGLTSTQVVDNYLEDNQTVGSYTHLVAEIVGSSISNSANDDTNYTNEIQVVVNDLENVVNTAQESNATSNTINYTPVNTNNSISNLIYTPVSDICADLTNNEYYAFEDWDSNQGGGYIEKRELKNIFIDQNDKLQIKTEVYNSGWSIDTAHSTFETNYLSNVDEIIINMAQVNSSSYTKPMYDLPLPADKISCNGSSAIFNANGFKYKLIATQSDINGLQGTSLPLGSTVGSIINPVTFGSGDKIYKILAIIQDDVYGINKNNLSPNPSDYIVYDEATLAPMSNSANISSMVQLTDTDFIVNFIDTNNYTKLELVTTASSQNNGIVNVVKVENSITTSTVTKTYHVETHNSHPFFVVENYKGMGFDLFLGKIDTVDGSSFVYGSVVRAGLSFYFTQGGMQGGDILDDILLNQSAKNRILSTQSITHP